MTPCVEEVYGCYSCVELVDQLLKDVNWRVGISRHPLLYYCGTYVQAELGRGFHGREGFALLHRVVAL